jgi:hypothetical protein
MATLFTRILDNGGNGIPGHVIRLRRRWGISGRAGGVTAEGDLILTTDANGFVSAFVLSGEYRVWVGSAEPRKAVIPDAEGTYLLQELLGLVGSTPLTYRYSGDELQILNGTTGAWHGFRITGSAGAMTISIDEVGGTTPNYKWEAGTLFIRNTQTSSWHAIHLTGSVPQIALGADGELITANARLAAGVLQLKNLTTGLYHTIYLTGAASSWAIAAGEA